MLFKDFVEHAHKGGAEVTLDRLVTILKDYHHGLGNIDIIPIKYEPPHGEAFFRRVTPDRTSAYGPEFWHVEICYCQSLNDTPQQRRYALTKELMHAFDEQEAWAKDKEAFKRLISDIQNNPLPADRNEVFKSELSTRWKALVALCPREVRDRLTSEFKSGAIEDYEIAAIFGLPEWLVKYIVDDYFVTAYDSLTS